MECKGKAHSYSSKVICKVFFIFRALCGKMPPVKVLLAGNNNYLAIIIGLYLSPTTYANEAEFYIGNNYSP